eukprot:1142748-Pelagomonas_calceolata.AAC.2
MTEGTHRGLTKNFWVVPQFQRNVRHVDSLQVTDYSCQHCGKTLDGFNIRLTNTGADAHATAAENYPAPEVQQMVLAIAMR